MFIVDDPLLALILRFVTHTDRSLEANEEFLQRQLKAIKYYLTQSPAHEQEPKVMEWIAQQAEKYRRDWQTRAVPNRTLDLRCEDCPLASLGAAEHCEIHEQWLYLLRQYTAGEINSRNFIESALDSLRHYKETLKLRGPTQVERTGQSLKLKKKKAKKAKKNK